MIFTDEHQKILDEATVELEDFLKKHPKLVPYQKTIEEKIVVAKGPVKKKITKKTAN